MKKKCRKRHVTLVEMMIVMFLIAMIIGVVAYNYSGSLEEGKAFKTKTGIEKIHTILDLHLATHPDDKNNIESNWERIISDSQLTKNAGELTKDGWGNKYTVTTNNEGEIEVSSSRFIEYQRSKKGSLFSAQ